MRDVEVDDFVFVVFKVMMAVPKPWIGNPLAMLP